MEERTKEAFPHIKKSEIFFSESKNLLYQRLLVFNP
jgi:hypothetical protein